MNKRIQYTGYAFILLAILFFVLSFYKGTWPAGECVTTFTDFYKNFCSEFLSLGVTILVIDSLYDQKDKQQANFREAHEKEELKTRLIREMGSGDRGLTYRAVEELRLNGWLNDGSLNNIDLSFANLSRINLKGASLVGVNLSNAVLTKTNFSGADLREANFENAELEEAKLESCKLSKCNFKLSKFMNANLNKATILESDFLKANFKSAEMREAKIQDSIFEDADFSLCDFSHTTIKNSNLSRADLTSLIVKDAIFERINFTDVKNWDTLISMTKNNFLGIHIGPQQFLDSLKN